MSDQNRREALKFALSGALAVTAGVSATGPAHARDGKLGELLAGRGEMRTKGEMAYLDSWVPTELVGVRGERMYVDTWVPSKAVGIKEAAYVDRWDPTEITLKRWKNFGEQAYPDTWGGEDRVRRSLKEAAYPDTWGGDGNEKALERMEYMYVDTWTPIKSKR